MYNRARSYSADLFNPSEATAKLRRSFSSRSLDLLSIDDDLELCGQEETEASKNESCCCYPVSLDTCYDIISDTDAFQVKIYLKVGYLVGWYGITLNFLLRIGVKCWVFYGPFLNHYSLFLEKSAGPSRSSWQQEIHIWSHKKMRWNSGASRAGGNVISTDRSVQLPHIPVAALSKTDLLF